MTGWLRGSWRQFEHGAANKVAAVRNEARLLSARATCVQQALDLSEGLAAAQVLRDFRDLELKQVIGPILAVLRECVTVMLASTGGGALIGGVAGAFAGGVGAIPGVALGATLGAQLGELILLLMGLKALTEYIVQDMPEISRNYWHGIREAWLAARLTPLPQQPVHVDQPALRHAAETLARAHVAMLVLLLTGIVAYLAKGRGTIGDLAKSVRGSKLGPGVAEWLVKNEGRLRAEPRLRGGLERKKARTIEGTEPRLERKRIPSPPTSQGLDGNRPRPISQHTTDAGGATRAPSLQYPVSTERNTAFFWSGRTNGEGGEAVARQIANKNGGTTLEALIEKRAIQMPAWNPTDPNVVSAWKNISADYANGASGTVNAVVGKDLRPGNVWETSELPALMKNPDVTKINIIDPATGISKTIFERGAYD